jgi:hypothetical protein
MSMPQIEWIHNSESQSDAFVDQLVSKWSNYPPFTQVSPEIGRFHSHPNLFEDEIALFRMGEDGKRHSTSLPTISLGIIISFPVENRCCFCKTFLIAVRFFKHIFLPNFQFIVLRKMVEKVWLLWLPNRHSLLQ